MAGEFGGGGFLGGIGGLVTSIASFIKGFLAITVKDLLRLVKWLKDGIVDLTKAMLDGVWKLGRALARSLVAILRLAGSGLKSFLLWVNRKLLALEQFLKAKFAPLLKFLRDIKQHIDDIYKKFIRPIIDTIEFIRQFNRILQIFHIRVLGKLDSTLQQIEQRIEEPFLWARQHITELENWINRIVTLDGLFQKLTLIRSMSRYAPAWINGFWNRQIDPSVASGDDYSRTRDYPSDAKWANGKELAQFYRGEDNRMQARVSELVQVWRVASGLDPPDGAEG